MKVRFQFVLMLFFFYSAVTILVSPALYVNNILEAAGQTGSGAGAGGGGQAFNPTNFNIIIDQAKPIWEGSTSRFTIKFRDYSGQPATPTQLKYVIDDENTKTRILPLVTVTTGLSADYTFEIAATANKIVSQDQKYSDEIHTLTAEAIFPTSKPVTGKATFKVSRLRFFPF